MVKSSPLAMRSPLVIRIKNKMSSVNENDLDKLIKRRLRVITSLIGIMVFAYGSLVVGMSFFPDFLSQFIRHGSSITYGFIFLVLVILSSIFTCGFYMWWMEKQFDPSMHEIAKHR